MCSRAVRTVSVSARSSSGRPLVVRLGHAPGFGQTRGEDPHELCCGRANPGSRFRQVALHGWVRQAEAMADTAGAVASPEHIILPRVACDTAVSASDGEEVRGRRRIHLAVRAGRRVPLLANGEHAARQAAATTASSTIMPSRLRRRRITTVRVTGPGDRARPRGSHEWRARSVTGCRSVRRRDRDAPRLSCSSRRVRVRLPRS